MKLYLKSVNFVENIFEVILYIYFHFNPLGYALSALFSSLLTLLLQYELANPKGRQAESQSGFSHSDC